MVQVRLVLFQSFILSFPYIFTPLTGIAQDSDELGSNMRHGYYVTWAGDTIRAIYKVQTELCGVGNKIKFMIEDESGVLAVTSLGPEMIAGFGYQNKHYMTFGYQKDRNVLHFPKSAEKNVEPAFAEVHHKGKYSLVTYTHYEVSAGSAVAFGLMSAAMGCISAN